MTRIFGPGYVETLLLQQSAMFAGYVVQVRASQQAEVAFRKRGEMEMAYAQANFDRLSKQAADQ